MAAGLGALVGRSNALIKWTKRSDLSPYSVKTALRRLSISQEASTYLAEANSLAFLACRNAEATQRHMVSDLLLHAF